MKRRIVVLLRATRRAPHCGATSPDLGPCDDAALRTAFALAKTARSITAVTAGETDDECVLQRALERGATRAIRLQLSQPDLEAPDPWTVSAVIGRGLQRIGFDIVLAGDRSANWGRGAVGVAVAHHLGLPHLSRVRSVADDGERLFVRRAHDDLLLSLRVQLPVVLTIAAPPSSTDEQLGPPATASAIEVLDFDQSSPFNDEEDSTAVHKPFALSRTARTKAQPALLEASDTCAMLAGLPELYECLGRLGRLK